MAQHDYNIANGGGAAVRADINNALTAVQSLNSGASAPTSTVAGMLWYDTNTGTLKQRNAANTAWVAAAELIGGGGQFAGMRNKIINGKMEIAQRGTSFAAIANNTYTVDRFVFVSGSTSAVITASQQSDVPSSNEFQNSLRLAVTTADTSIAAGEYVALSQIIEGYNVRDLIGKTFTLSFWVRSSKIGIHCVRFSNSAQDRSYVAEYTINAANTWEQKSITVSGGLITAGTWNWTNGAGLYVSWVLAAGTTIQTTAGAWQTGSFLATSSQVNCLDAISNIFAITGVQLEVGGVATPFEHRPFGVELALCQRYYQAAADILGLSVYSAGLGQSEFVRYLARMRADTHTVTVTPSSFTTVGYTSTSSITTSANGFRFVFNTPSAVNTIGAGTLTWTASAEL